VSGTGPRHTRPSHGSGVTPGSDPNPAFVRRAERFAARPPPRELPFSELPIREAPKPRSRLEFRAW